MNLNWNNIRPLENSCNNGFEELVCQLARKEVIHNKKKYQRFGIPDGGIECYWELDDGSKWAWQAKYYTSSLTSSQWSKVDNSIKTALDKQENLKKYFVALPIDPSHSGIKEHTTMFDIWNARVEKWKGWAQDKGLEVEFIPWWSSDLIDRLQRPGNEGLTYFWFNKEEFTSDWFKEQNELAIADLGSRYTSELNVKLNLARDFGGISRNHSFKQRFTKIIDKLLICGDKALPHIEELNDERKEIKDKLKVIYNIFQGINIQGCNDIPANSISNAINELEGILQVVYQYYITEEKIKKDTSQGYYTIFGYEIHHCLNLFRQIGKLSDFLNSATLKLANSPFLILNGDGGIGKSHLLADIVNNRNAEKLSSLFFLGQHFVTEEDPWTQIFKKNNIRCSVDEFLGALSSKAQIKENRIVLFIDALNEGKGKYFWGNNLNAFIAKIQKYKWLGLVLSIRDTYVDLILPKQVTDDKNITQITHSGFQQNLNEATQLFFNFYKIDLPSVPLLHSEFNNPLFLKTFCEGLKNSGKTKIPDGFHGISSVINLFVSSINKKISAVSLLNFNPSLNIVKKVIHALLEYKINNYLPFVSYEDALRITIVIANEYGISTKLLDELILIGLLSKNLFWTNGSNEEGIYLAYERFEDHLQADVLISKSSNVKQDLKDGGNLFHLVKGERACRYNKGLLEAFAIQLPEKSKVELHDLVPDLKDTFPIIDCFIQSLLWRKTETISDKLIPYINNYVLRYNEHVTEKFTDILIAITSIPNHFFNAKFMHKRLMGFSLADRDAWWTQFLKNQTFEENAVNRLIKWAWNAEDKSYVSDESLKLCSTTITWFLTSTNRKLRDSSTKALVCLLENRLSVLIELLKEFEKVNDPYVYERLFAVAYGCALRTEQKDKLVDLSHYIFEIIFDKDKEIYPHILLRDYARGVIEYSNHLNQDLSFDISKVRPPYKSKFYKRFPTNKYIDAKYKLDYESDDLKKHYWPQNNILDSMTTEYGRGIGGYGDFGRYTFQSAFYSFDVNTDKLSNLAVQWIFTKYGYDKDKHGKFDNDLGYGRGINKNNNERIGKKYQWLAMHEMLARVADNCIKYDDSYPKNIEKYTGPWEPNIRDIDPTTIIINNVGSNNSEKYNGYWWQTEAYTQWQVKNKQWIEQKNDFPKPKNLLNVIDEDKVEWLVLTGFPDWNEPVPLGQEKFKIPSKIIFYTMTSYLVKENEFGTLKNYLSSLNDFWDELPESFDSYSIMNNEFYWSPAFNYFRKNVPKYHVVRTKNKDIANVINTTEQYYWAEALDMSKEDRIKFLKPSKYIFQHMKLINSNKDSVVNDTNNNRVCFDPSVDHMCKQYLLIKKKPFVKFLKDNKLKIIWTVYGAKQIIGSKFQTVNSKTDQNIVGVYYLNNNNDIEGSYKIK